MAKPVSSFIERPRYDGQEMHCFGDDVVPALAVIIRSVLVLRHQRAELVKTDENLVERQVKVEIIPRVTTSNNDDKKRKIDNDHYAKLSTCRIFTGFSQDKNSYCICFTSIMGGNKFKRLSTT